VNAPHPALEKQDLAKLVASLDEETGLQEELARLLTRKERLLVQGDLAGLQSLLTEAGALVGRLEESTARRAKTVHALGRRIRRDPERLTLKELAAAAAGPADRAPLEAAAAKLRAALERVRLLNRRCVALARQGADLNRALVHVLFGAAPPAPSYGRDGRRVETPAVARGFAREA
jgi:flagellar biosynthesis/type III secretory pathway chaperone